MADFTEASLADAVAKMRATGHKLSLNPTMVIFDNEADYLAGKAGLERWEAEQRGEEMPQRPIQAPEGD